MRTNKIPINSELVERMKLQLCYDEITGKFTWLNPSKYHNNLTGSVAGEISRNGYRLIQFEGRKYSAHRMAWAFVHGEITHDEEIDHKNNDRDDNSISNLRIASFSQNARNQLMHRNNTSGVKGVSFHRQSGKWRARICIHGTTHYLGHFSDIKMAEESIMSAREKLHGEYSNHG